MKGRELMPVYYINCGIINALGNSSSEVYSNIIAGQSAIRLCNDITIEEAAYHAAPMTSTQYDILKFEYGATLSLVEKMACKVIDEAMQDQEYLLMAPDFQLYIATTKGNIVQLGQNTEAVLLQSIGKVLQLKYQLAKSPIIVSNACISGASAIILAKRAIETQWINHALVVGVDAFTAFVYKGFQSFHAISKGHCKPFDVDRDGINLGEAAAAILWSSDKMLVQVQQPTVVVSGGGMTNDANHLSGPSRSGAELGKAILNAMDEAHVAVADIAVISTHGTATIFNDEMESKAIHFAGLEVAKVYSLKSYIGHTLGAAGVIESAIGILAMQANMSIASLNFTTIGTPMPLVILTKTEQLQHRHFLKTASGFGGCNAAVVYSKFD